MQIFVRWAETGKEEPLSLSAESATLGAVWAEVCAVAEAAWGWDLDGGLEVVVPSGDMVEDAGDERPAALEDGSFVAVREGRTVWRERFASGELCLWHEELPQWVLSDVGVICACLTNARDTAEMAQVSEAVTGNDAAMRRICSEHPDALEYADRELPLLEDAEYILALIEPGLYSRVLRHVKRCVFEDDDFMRAACKAAGSSELITHYREDLLNDRPFMNGVYCALGEYHRMRDEP